MSNPLSQFILDQGVARGGKIMRGPDYERARAAGFSDEQIKAIAKENGIFFGGYVAQKMGYASPLAQFMPEGRTVMYGPNYEKAKAAGFTDEQIKTLAKENGIYFGGYVAKTMGYASPLAQFMADPNGKNFDSAAYSKAVAAGFTDQQIGTLLQQNNLINSGGATSTSATGGTATSPPGQGSSPSVTAPSAGPSPVPGAQQGYEQALQSNASTGATSAAGAYQAAFQQSLQNYSNTSGAQQSYQQTLQSTPSAGDSGAAAAYQTAFQQSLQGGSKTSSAQEAYNSAASAGSTGGTGPATEYQAAYQSAASSSAPQTNQQELANYQSAYNQAIRGLGSQGATDADYRNYVVDYETALKNATAANAQSQPTSYQSAYENAAKNQPSPSGTNEYLQMYNDLVKRTSEDYDKQIGRYQEDLTKSRTDLNQARSERDAAVERATQWEKRFNDDAAYAADEQLRGVRSGSTATGSQANGVSLQSGQSAYSDSDRVGRKRPGVTISAIRRAPGDYEAAAGSGPQPARYV